MRSQEAGSFPRRYTFIRSSLSGLLALFAKANDWPTRAVWEAERGSKLKPLSPTADATYAWMNRAKSSLFPFSH
ncbi:MAG: hypothetical protein DMG88_13385 [Acidobacteria bacterium]|nr:MAG: hypothetical protein DMG88_13385 [Acidobacteriota bacterium]